MANQHPLTEELDNLKRIINTTDDADEFEYAWMKFQLIRFKLEDN